MSGALLCGFLHNFVEGYNFERLHIFLFNLCSGGSVILAFVSNFKKNYSYILMFFGLSFLYAFMAFFELYIFAVILSILLFLIVEKIRKSQFVNIAMFFNRNIDASYKFQHASLLCLSIALVISIFAIINHYINLFYFRKLTLDSFFLGFSFPISLITFSVIFALIDGMSEAQHKRLLILKELMFWTINAGVVIFFVFILIENEPLELFISTVLSGAVATSFILFIFFSKQRQEKFFLISGMLFLIVSAITGIIYILIVVTCNDKWILNIILDYHRLVSLYGWNLAGIAIICRHNDFPIKLNSKSAIFLHWLTVAVFAPLALFSKVFSIVAVACYLAFLIIMFYSKSSNASNEI